MKTWDRPEVQTVEIKETAWGAFPAGKMDVKMYTNSIKAISPEIQMLKKGNPNPTEEDLFSGL